MSDTFTNLPTVNPYAIEPEKNTRPGPTAWELSEARLKREKAATTGSYLGSIWRQDGLVDGLMAHLAGEQMVPQQGYWAGTDPAWKDLTDGIDESYHRHLYDAHSPAHAQFIRQRLLQKQEDIVRLGDMGVAGNVGRVAANILMPENFLMGMAGGWVTRGARAVQGLKMTELGKAAAASTAVQQAGSKGAVAMGVASGAVENVIYERIRQSVNFEDDDAELLMAGLMGGVFTAPFAVMGARASKRVAQATADEHALLQVMAKQERGEAINPAEAKVLKKGLDTHEAIKEHAEGKLDDEAFAARMDDIMGEKHGPVEPPDEWMKRWGQKLKEDTDAFIAEAYPGHKGRATGQPKADPAPMPESHADEAAAKPLADAAVAKAAELDTPNAMQSAFKRALQERKVRQDKQAAQDLKDGGAGKAERAAAWAEVEKARKAAKDSVWDKAAKDMGLQKDRELTAMQSERELQDAGLSAPHEAPHKATVPDPTQKPVEATQAPDATHATPEPAAPSVDPSRDDMDALWEAHQKNKAAYDALVAENDAALEPLWAEFMRAKAVHDAQVAANEARAAAKSMLGKRVSWVDAKGNDLEGVVTDIAGNGKLKVDTFEGDRWVWPKDTDQWGDQGPLSDTPDGFLPGSIGAAQVRAIVDAQKTTSMSKARMDFFAILNRSEHPLVRELAFDLIKDAGVTSDTHAQKWTASEWKKHLQRSIGGNFMRTAEEAVREAIVAAKVPMTQRGKFKTDFYELVTAVTRDEAFGRTTTLNANPDIAPMLTKAAKAQQKAYSDMLEEAKRSGVLGADEIQANAAYVNRNWDYQKLRDAEVKHGKDAVIQLLADAMIVPATAKALTPAERLKKATSFFTAVKRLEHNGAFQEVHLKAQDMGTLRRELADAGLPPDHVDSIVDVMFDAHAMAGEHDAGRTTNMKFRLGLDEGFDNGAGLKMSDLFENDSRVLMDKYLNTMGGQAGLGRIGIRSNAEWAERIKEITEAALEKPGHDGARLANELRYLNDLHANIAGIPMSTADFSKSARAANATRALVRSVSLGQLGLTAAVELNRAVALMGFKAVWQSLPSFRGFIKALRQGHLPDSDLARDVMMMGGWGNDMAQSYARAQEIESGFVGGSLTRFEKFANKASHFTDHVSGNASFTSMTRQIAAMATVRQAVEVAQGVKKLTPAMRKRWVGQGLDDAEIDEVLAALKLHSTHKGTVVDSIDYERWLKDDPSTYDSFQLFMSRQVRDAIQDHDIGETMPFMHTTIGKIFGELKTFMFVGHAKNMLKNLHFRDATTLNGFFISIVAESMAYSLQAAINFPDKLDEKLRPEAVVSAALSRTSTLGIMATVAGSAYSAVTDRDLFDPGSTANTDSRSFWKTPSLMMAMRLGNAPGMLGSALGMGATTRTEAADTLRLIPRYYGLPALANEIAGYFPEQDPQRGQ